MNKKQLPARRQRYFQLIAQAMNSTAPAHTVGVSKRTRKVWRNGRTRTNQRQETRAERYAAHLLINPTEYAHIERIYGVHKQRLAHELGVTVHYIEVWQSMNTHIQLTLNPTNTTTLVN